MMRSERWSMLALAVAAVASIGLGTALLLVPLSVQQIAAVTGAGIAVAGLVLALRGAEDRALAWVARLSGAALLVIGALMAVWPDAGAPWLAATVALSLIVHGVVSGVAALGGDADRRVSGVFLALAGIAVGVLAFSWPVLTLALFRLGVGAWLLFGGFGLLFEMWRRRSAHGHGRGAERGRREPNGDPAHRRSGFARWSRTIAAGLALVLAAGAAYGSAQLLGGTPQPVPGPFYSAPDEVPSAHGRLIRTETLTTGVPEGAQAWRMLYTTTHPDGSPAISSGTILAPAKRDGSPLPLLSVAHGTTGVVDGCAPSLGALPFSDGAGTAMAEMVTEQGWVAVTSDYTGMGTDGTTAYLVGEAEARNVLDASLAAQQFQELSMTTDTVVWGHSQGGQGSLWTGQIAIDYAPELTVLGVAAFAPAADLFGLAEADKDNAGGKTVSAYIAATWNEVFPELSLESHLTPGSAGPVERISQLCFNGSDALAAILRGSQVPNQIFPDSLLDGDFGRLLKEQTPTGPWPAPVLVAQGLSDPLVLPKLQQQWVHDRCDAGAVLDYRTFVGLSHVSLVAADSPLTPQIVEWTLDRWNGVPAPAGCTSKEYPESKA